MPEDIQPPSPTPEGFNSFVERMREVYKDLRDNRAVLWDLHNEGKTDELSERIGELADELMAEDTTYVELLQRLREARRGPAGRNGESEIIAQIRALKDVYRDMVVTDLNLPEKSRLEGLDRAAADVADYLSENGFDGKTPAQALRILGITVMQDNGSASYQFPDEFMPQEVKKKWESYLTAVARGLKSADNLSKGANGSSQAEVQEDDRARRFAHNIVTEDVHHILGLEATGKWTLADTKDLLASIREELMPTRDALSDPHILRMLDENHGMHMVAKHLSAAPKKS